MFRLTVVALAVAVVLAGGAYASDGSPWDALDTIAARVGLIEATDAGQTAALAELKTRLERPTAPAATAPDTSLIHGRKACKRLARWRDQILSEDYRPPVHHALAEEAWSMACGPL